MRQLTDSRTHNTMTTAKIEVTIYVTEPMQGFMIYPPREGGIECPPYSVRMYAKGMVDGVESREAICSFDELATWARSMADRAAIAPG